MKPFLINAFPKGRAPGLTAVFTTRKGGVSTGKYRSLNLGTQTHDSPKKVKQNLAILAKSLGAKRLITVRQVHGAEIADYKSALKNRLLQADAIAVNAPGKAIAVKTADCAGVIIYDPVRKAVSVVHAGWKGMAGFITHNAVKYMQKKYGSAAPDLTASISPAIGSCCYEIGEELYNSLKTTPEFSNIFIRRKNKFYMDLKKGVKNTLLSAGIKKGRIYVSGLCTSCGDGLFFSHRRDKGVTGRCASAAIIDKAEKCTKKRKNQKR